MRKAETGDMGSMATLEKGTNEQVQGAPSPAGSWHGAQV